MGSGDRKGRKGTGRGESAAGKGIGEKFLVINKKKKKEKQQQEFLLNNSCLLIMADPSVIQSLKSSRDTFGVGNHWLT